MRITTRLKGKANVKTLSEVRLALMNAALDLNKFRAEDNSERMLLQNIRAVIEENCGKLSDLEGELINAGIQ